MGALFVVGSSVMDSCLCLDAHTRTRSKKKILGSASARKMELGSSFTSSGIVFRISSKKRVPRIANRRKKLLIVSEDVAGNYDDTFGDVKTVRKICSWHDKAYGSLITFHFCRTLLTISRTKL